MNKELQNAARHSNYITPEGIATLREELRYLWNVDRPNVTRMVSAAAAEGDRSENAEYIYGKKRLREIDRRVRFLIKRIEALTVVEPRRDGTGKIFFGAWVRLENEDGDEVVYRIVGPDEFDPKKGWISIDSPMAKALLGKEEGDEVLVKRPAGAATFTVLDVGYAPLTNKQE